MAAAVAVDALFEEIPQVPLVFCQFFVPAALRVFASLLLVKLSVNAFSFSRTACTPIIMSLNYQAYVVRLPTATHVLVALLMRVAAAH